MTLVMMMSFLGGPPSGSKARHHPCPPPARYSQPLCYLCHAVCFFLAVSPTPWQSKKGSRAYQRKLKGKGKKKGKKRSKENTRAAAIRAMKAKAAAEKK